MPNCHIYPEFSQRLIAITPKLYANEPIDVEPCNTVYALESTAIDLCLSAFPWATFRSTTTAATPNTLLDLRGNILSFLNISDGTFHDVNILEHLPPEAGAFYIIDRDYVEYERLPPFAQAGAFFETRAKRSMHFKRLGWHKTDHSAAVISDHTIALTFFYSKQGCPNPLHRGRFEDPDTGKNPVFVTNHLSLKALRVCQLHTIRWQVELFFKSIKQHPRIDAFFGTSVNAVMSQIWIGVRTNVLVTIARKQLKLDASMHEILRILSVTLFESTLPDHLLTLSTDGPNNPGDANQLSVFQ